MKNFIFFYLVACLFSWIVWMPLYLPYFGTRFSIEIPYNHALGALGPLIAAIVMVAIEKGRKGLTVLFQRMVAIRPIRYLFVALFSPFLLLFLAGGIQYLQTGIFPDLTSVGTTTEFPQFTLITFFLYNLIFFGFGEEVGWAGYGVPALQKKFSPLTTAVFFTVSWALWHLPLFLYRPGYTSMDIAGITGWFFSLLTGRILLIWLQNASRSSILIPAIFHATIDIAFTSEVTNQNITQYLGVLITLWGLFTVFLMKRKRPSANERPLMQTEIKPVS